MKEIKVERAPITLVLGDQTITLTEEEARSLLAQLKSELEQNFTITYPPYPVIPVGVRPWWEYNPYVPTVWPTDGTGQKGSWQGVEYNANTLTTSGPGSKIEM